MEARLSLEADASALRQVDEFVTAFVKDRGLAPDEAPRILILLEELLTNLVKYGYPDRSLPGRVEVILGLSGSRLSIEFIDDGRAFNPIAERVSNLEAPAETRPIGGLGLHIMRSLTEDAHYERRDNLNVVRMSRLVARAKSS